MSERMRILFIWRQRREAWIVDVAADREVIDGLEGEAGKPEHLVHRIVIEAADARGAHERRLGLEVEHLADRARLPVEAPIKPWAVGDQRALVLGDHAQRERAVACDVLLAAHLRR